jgi:alpha-tubulin suppressor-like RCC1 family protein
LPVQIGTDKNWASVVTSGDHTVAIKTDGTLWAWGDNYWGQLGDGTTINKSYPVKIGDKYEAVYAKYNFTTAIKKDKILWAWGDNTYGQLGDGTLSNRLIPQRVVESGW